MSRRGSKRAHAASSDDEEDVKSSQLRLSQWTEEDINISKSDSIGIIERIHVRNFMCHASMEINFNERINFVVGRNGSGKSAILMALVVGLGGKASATNRGSSLKEFIKKGEKTATVEIVLKNSGLSPYKHDVYGDRITVIRALSNGPGPTGYKIKSATGAVVSTKREELDRVITTLNIQVDNPVSVLNQDTSRTFLNSSDPGDKYNLFMRATELDKLDRYHKEAVATRAAAMTSVSLKKEALLLTKKEVDELHKRWSVLKSIPQHKKKIEALENELLWAQVLEKERLLEKAQNIMLEEEARLKKLSDRFQNQKNLEEEMQEKLRNLAARLEELKAENANYEETWNAAKAKYVRCKESFSVKAKDGKTLHGRVERLKVNRDTLTEEINRLQQETGPDYFERRAADKQRMADLEVALAEKQATLLTVNHHHNQQRNNEQPLVDELHRLKAERQEKQQRRDRIRAGIRDLRNSKGSNLSLFNRHTAKFHAAIDEAHRAGRFVRKPVGPLGAYIQVRDPRWTVAVEACLGANVLKYACHCAADNRVLTQLMQKVIDENRAGWTARYPEPQPGKVTSKFVDTVHDTSRRAVRAEGFMNVFDAIAVSDVAAANTLINEASPETVVLLPTSDDAYRMMGNRNNVPANCRRGFTMAGDQYFPSPNYKTYAGTRNKAIYLQVDTEDAIRQREAQLVTVEQELSQLEEQVKHATAQLAETRRQLNIDAAERQKLRSAVQRITAEIASLRDTAEPEVNCITTLTTELDECAEQIGQLEEREAQLAQETRDLRAQMDEAKREADQLRQNAHLANVKEQPILTEMEQTRGDLRSFKADQQYRKTKVDELQVKVDDAKLAVTKARDIVSTYTDNAEQVVPRIDTRRKASDLVEEKRALEVYLASVEREKGSYLEVTQEYQDKKTKYQETSEKVEENVKLCRILSDGLKWRSKYYQSIIRLTQVAVNFYFKFRLEQRQYKGDLKFDDVNKTLSVDVTPAHRASDASKKDTKTLSGGERSYSTVVFIMALWDSVNLPFYFLDEFDVFMDKVNRRIIMDMLLEVARDKSNRQFVFLTPQDTSAIKTGPHTTIHRMEDPRN